MPERSREPCFATGSMPGRKSGGLALLHELLASATQFRGDAVFDSKERPELAGQTPFADHLLEQIAQQRWIETALRTRQPAAASPGIGSATTMCVR